jgi:cation diffusion facilitator family transporter
VIAGKHVPEEIREDLDHAKRLAWWTLFWIGQISIIMFVVMGASQAMKTAFVEDVLSLLPAMVFLIAARFECKEGTAKFPYGFKRINSLAFLVSAVALFSIGAFMSYEATMSLIKAEHPSIGLVSLFGRDIWLGWVMMAALAYSCIPPVILGRKKLPIARRTHDMVLHTDAQTQKADWQTALAGIVGIAGIGFGLWWSDAAAALFIALSILKDGLDNVRKSTAELADGVPRALESHAMADDAQVIRDRLEQHYPDAEIRLRKSGRYILAEIVGDEITQMPDIESLAPAECKWRLAQVSFVPRKPWIT